MKLLRCVTVTPSLSYGSTNAVMPPSGTCAMTTTTSAIAPFVAHSLEPFRR